MTTLKGESTDLYPMTADGIGKVRFPGQPVDNVRWVPRDWLQANDYNPNHVAPREMRLLRESILADGWTQPIVVRRLPEYGRYEIVDGFHRFTVSKDPEIAAKTDGLVPVVELSDPDPAHQRASTIRHNRARGTHTVVKMADIVHYLLEDLGMDAMTVGRQLGMEDEEVNRLYERGNMLSRGPGSEFGKGWVPTDE